MDRIQLVKNGAGFTLIETLIYIALFGIIMGGVSVAAYGIVEAGGRDQAKINLQDEGNFLIAKFNWALSGASGVSVGASPPRLTVSKYVYNANPLVFDVSGTALRLKEGIGDPENLNSDSVKIASIVFTNPPSPGKPEGVKINFTLNSLTPNGQTVSQDFEMTKYVRK